MKITNTQIAKYTEAFTTEEPEIVKELIAASVQDLNHTDMLSGRQVGMLLRLLIQLSGAERVLEIGTFSGYSALMMAGVLPNHGRLITLEKNERYHRISGPFFSRKPFNRKIKQILGPALETIPRITGDFDFVYLDADKTNYPQYYSLIRPRVKKGGLIVIDNSLWGGKVLKDRDDKATAIDTLNRMIRDDSKTEQLLLPLRDGVMIVRIL